MREDGFRGCKRICLLTGPPGCGKTTVICRVVKSLQGLRIAGFVTTEIRDGPRRMGFRAETVDEASCVMAHRSIRSQHRVGAYGVDVGTFDRVVVHPMEQAERPDLWVIDEIGKMELKSARFARLVERLTAGTIPVLATVPVTPPALVDQLCRRDDVQVISMSISGREAAWRALTEWCRERGFRVAEDNIPPPP